MKMWTCGLCFKELSDDAPKHDWQKPAMPDRPESPDGFVVVQVCDECAPKTPRVARLLAVLPRHQPQ